MATRKSSGKSRKKQALHQAEMAVNLIKPKIVNDDDKVKLADQCYHNNDATLLGTYTSTISKYAVFYCNRWFFCAYSRDERRVVDMLSMDMLTPGEMTRFMQFKNRLECEKRAQRQNTVTKK